MVTFFGCLVTTLHTYEAYGYFFGCLVTTLHTYEAYGYLFWLFGYHPPYL